MKVLQGSFLNGEDKGQVDEENQFLLDGVRNMRKDVDYSQE